MSAWCGIFRCCREKNHEGACEEDWTMLTKEEQRAASREDVQ